MFRRSGWGWIGEEGDWVKVGVGIGVERLTVQIWIMDLVLEILFWIWKYGIMQVRIGFGGLGYIGIFFYLEGLGYCKCYLIIT